MKIKEVESTILSYPKLASYLQEHPKELAQVQKILPEIAGDFNGEWVKNYIKIIDATFAKLYDGVSFDVPPDFDLNKLAEKYHLILVPNHQSHADYLALTYVIYGVYSVPVYVAGGINLNVFPIGKLFRKGGAFFIRRSFNNDITYKLTFEAYVFYLLKNNLLIEFFFEGGRSRTGKLLRPRYGLFQMLLEAHAHIKDSKPLMFIPVTLAHEQVPESGAHAKELRGGKKKKESASQLLKIFKVFSRKLGTIHVRFSQGIVIDKYDDLKSTVQNLAFDCFGSIAKAMPLTPMSLISLIMLDEPSGTMTWPLVEKRATAILDYCAHMKIPTSASLDKDKYINSTKHALDILIENNKVELIIKENLKETFYSILPKARAELLYFKNMIIHHFLVPAIMNGAWFNVNNGSFKTVKDLSSYLITQRKELKYEFYLPSVKEFLFQSLKVASYALKEDITDLKQCLSLGNEKMVQMSQTLKLFSSTFVYIYEAYYLGATSVYFLKNETFDKKRFLAVARDLFEVEREYGRIVHYYESYATPMLLNSLEFFTNLNCIESPGTGLYYIDNEEILNKYKDKFSKDVNEKISMGLH